MARALDSSAFSSTGGGAGMTAFSSATSFGDSTGSAATGAATGGASAQGSGSTFLASSSAIMTSENLAMFAWEGEEIDLEEGKCDMNS